jgi:ATP-dependent DNA ligase
VPGAAVALAVWDQARRLSAAGLARWRSRALYTRNGHDWADRFPAVVEAALALKATRFLIDGEVMVLCGCSKKSPAGR